MKKFEVEKADEMIKVAKEKVNTLSVMSPADGVIDDIITASNERNGMSGITLRHAGPFKVAGQMSEFELANVKLTRNNSFIKTVAGKTWTGKVTEIGSTPLKVWMKTKQFLVIHLL